MERIIATRDAALAALTAHFTATLSPDEKLSIELASSVDNERDTQFMLLVRARPCKGCGGPTA